MSERGTDPMGTHQIGPWPGEGSPRVTPSVPLTAADLAAIRARLEAATQRIAPRERDDGWEDAETGEWVPMPMTVRALTRPQDVEALLADIAALLAATERLRKIEAAAHGVIHSHGGERCWQETCQKAICVLSRLLEDAPRQALGDPS